MSRKENIPAEGAERQQTRPAPIREQCYKTLVRPQLEYASSVWDNPVKRNVTKIEAVQRNAARFTCRDFKRTSSITAMLQTAETPMGLSPTMLRNALSKCYIASGMAWLPYPPRLTFNQLPFSAEDPKPDIGRSSAKPTYSVIPSFQVQSACGMQFLSMSASCRRTASRLNIALM